MANTLRSWKYCNKKQLSFKSREANRMRVTGLLVRGSYTRVELICTTRTSSAHCCPDLFSRTLNSCSKGLKSRPWRFITATSKRQRLRWSCIIGNRTQAKKINFNTKKDANSPLTTCYPFLPLNNKLPSFWG